MRNAVMTSSALAVVVAGGAVPYAAGAFDDDGKPKDEAGEFPAEQPDPEKPRAAR